jgi:predicted phosphodiesterase
VRLGVISDVHLSLDVGDVSRWHGELDLAGSQRRLEGALERLRGEDVDLVLVTGDLTNHGDTPSLTRVIETLERVPLPVVVLPGNHDCAHAGALAAAIAERPARNVRLVSQAGSALAPGIRLAGRGDQPADGSFATGADHIAVWGDDLVVWATHFPVLSLARACAEAGLKYAGDADDVAAAGAALGARLGPTIVLAGHLHVRHAETHGSLLQLTAAALVEAPGDIALIEVERVPTTSVRRRVWESAPGDGEGIPVLAPLDETFVLGPSGDWARVADLRGDR